MFDFINRIEPSFCREISIRSPPEDVSVFVIAKAGSDEVHIEASAIQEGDKGLFLKTANHKTAETIGYVPYENLKYVAPGDPQK